MTLTLGLILFSMPGYAQPTASVDTPDASTMEVGANATRAACPNCSGTAHTITGVIFEAGMNCVCVGSVSLAVGAGTIVRNNATVIFKAPSVSVLSGAIFENGASVNLIPGYYPLLIAVVADPLSIPADGYSYAIITATVTDPDGQPAPQGTKVTFVTNLGTFGNAAETYTVTLADDSGKTSVFLRGTTAGTATVTATVDGITSTPVTVTIYDVSPAAIELQAMPTSILGDGQSTSTIHATVTDGNNNPVLDGTVVTFTVTTGTGSLSAGTATTTSGIANRYLQGVDSSGHNGNRHRPNRQRCFSDG